MVRSKSPLLLKNPCTLLKMGCPADSTLALYWNWFAGIGLEEISSSSPRDVSKHFGFPLHAHQKKKLTML